MKPITLLKMIFLKLYEIFTLALLSENPWEFVFEKYFSKNPWEFSLQKSTFPKKKKKPMEFSILKHFFQNLWDFPVDNTFAKLYSLLNIVLKKTLEVFISEKYFSKIHKNFIF